MKSAVVNKIVRKASRKNRIVEVPESNMWASEYEEFHSGFKAFKRRIAEQLQLMDADVIVDDDDLLPFYRMGESENFVLGALGCGIAV